MPLVDEEMEKKGMLWATVETSVMESVLKGAVVPMPSLWLVGSMTRKLAVEWVVGAEA